LRDLSLEELRPAHHRPFSGAGPLQHHRGAECFVEAFRHAVTND
jgi:hypothetical protein